MELIDGVAVFGDPIEESAMDQIRRSKQHPAVRAAALMADHHKGYEKIFTYIRAGNPAALAAYRSRVSVLSERQSDMRSWTAVMWM